MRVTQITHHDLDGYGAMTVAAALCDVARVVHVARYVDVGPVVEDELRRLSKTAEPETLLMTDLSLESQAVKFIRSFAALNRRRAEGDRPGHRLVVLDHHASTLGQMAEQGITAGTEDGLHRFDLGDPAITVLVDEGRCATRMTLAHAGLYATREAAGDGAGLEPLVAMVDALDLWRKDDPRFPAGQTLDEVFWDNVGPIVPLGHPLHDPFVAALLRAVAARLDAGATPAAIEAEVGAIRKAIVDATLHGDPEDDANATTRMRIARVLARSDALFRPLSDGTLLSFGLDAGTFQRVSDLIMERGPAKRVVNVQRMGSLSFRSVDGTALDGARRFRGGGHRDAAGGKLPNGSAYSLADAIAQVEPVLNPPPPDPSASPFGALKNWKG